MCCSSALISSPLGFLALRGEGGEGKGVHVRRVFGLHLHPAVSKQSRMQVMPTCKHSPSHEQPSQPRTHDIDLLHSHSQAAHTHTKQSSSMV
jgi:hypothetical protein